jgi:maltodextrin utilization protein YvdJ
VTQEIVMLVMNMMMLLLICFVLISATLLRLWLTRRESERKPRGFGVIMEPPSR